MFFVAFFLFFRFFFRIFMSVIFLHMVVFPPCLVARLGVSSSVVFSGSRSFSPSVFDPGALFSLVPSGCSVSVGCASGFDASVRSFFPFAIVFRARSFGVGRSSFARRSVALVASLFGSSAPLVVVVPCAPCPVGLVPSSRSGRCFAGFGSGSWASASFAVGSGLPCAVWVGAGASVPVGWVGGCVVGGWLFFNFEF